MSEYLLQMKDICKSFPGVKALDHVSFNVKSGTVHALMGENGAGKSTLMKCLFGIYKKDQGDILLDGQIIEIKSSQDALRHGIAMVHQELQPILERSIAENLFCGRYPLKKIGGIKIVDHQVMMNETKKLLEKVNLSEFDPKMKLSSLSLSQMQSVEIAKAVSYQAKVVIMDEPTSSLTENEVSNLFAIIQNLKAMGCAIIYISHKMEEILKISDEVTVMRDGISVGTWPACELTTELLIAKMVGRELTNRFPASQSILGEAVLQVEGLSSIHEASFQDVSFTLRKGEILGIGGLVGAQRSELMEGLFGLRSLSKGKIIYHGEEIKIKSPKDAIQKGLALLTEDRRATGIFGVLSIMDNVAIASLPNYLDHGFILNYKKLENVVQQNINKLQIKAPSSRSLIHTLSGGNQQKVIIARWLANEPDVLILDEPTRGIDVGAKYEIYTIMRELSQQGKSIIMISSEMSELLGMSDVIMVMKEGRVSGFVQQKEATQEIIMSLAAQL